MKFLCDSCKAKYQIADEKVVGKTLKMKCRKCGHIIEIRASAEVSTAPVGATMQLSALNEDQATQIAARPAGAPRPTGLPRPSVAPASAGPESRGPSSALATSFKSQSLANAGTDPPSEEWYVSIDEVPVGPIRLSDLRSKYTAGAITDDSLVWREGFEEWRPLQAIADLHALLRAEAAQRPSMVPARPAAKQPAARPTSSPSIAATSPGHSSPSAMGRGNVIPFSRQTGSAARKLDDLEDDEPTQVASKAEIDNALRQARQNSSTSPSANEASAAAAGFAASATPARSQTNPTGPAASVIADPFASFGTAPTALAPSSAISPIAPFATASAARPVSEIPPAATKKGISAGLVALIGAGCVFVGVVVAVLVLKKPPVEPTVVERERIVEKRVEVAVPGATITLTAAPLAPAPTTSASADPGTKIAIRGPAGTPLPGTSPAPTTSSTKLGKIDLGPDIPIDPGGGGGGGGGTTGPAKAEGALDGAKVQSYAQSRSKSVERSCYQEYVGSGPANARIRVLIAPDGSVTSAGVESGSPPSFASCVQRLVKGWRFPVSGTGGSFIVPFVFNS